MVLGVTLKLVSGEKEKIEAVMQELRQKRAGEAAWNFQVPEVPLSGRKAILPEN